MKFVAKQKIFLIDLLLSNIGGSKVRIKERIKASTITINGNICTLPNPELEPGSIVELSKKMIETSLNFRILFEDDALIAVEKPINIISSGKSKNEKLSMVDLVGEYVRKRSKGRENIFITHRLDQKVSGILIFAKSQSVLDHLQLNWKSYKKCYHALCEGTPQQLEGKIESWLSETKTQKVYSGPKSATAKFAVTHYRVLKHNSRNSLIDIELDTGRKNQIRVHLADLGCPIVGDIKYGAQTDPIKRIGLHCYSFSLKHPITGQNLEIESRTPKSFSAALT